MRTTIGAARRRKKNRLFKKAKGYTGGRRRLLRSMKETLLRAEAFAFRDRRARKREFRKLWIIRINAAVRERGLKYSEFIKPSELAAWLRAVGLELEDLSGLMYEPWKNSARVVSRTDVNYLACAVKPRLVIGD